MPKYEGPLVGLKGEIFDFEGQVAGTIPPCGVPGAIQFEVFGEYPGQNPPWADMGVCVDGREIKCRINPTICQPPYARLFDCVAVVGKTDLDFFPRIESHEMAGIWLPPQPHPDSQQFVFTLAFNGKLVLIDTAERAERFSRKQRLKIRDGQHRTGN
jgi:hypothetical protein